MTIYMEIIVKQMMIMNRIRNMIVMANVMRYDMNDIKIETDFDGGLGYNIDNYGIEI